MKAFNKNRIALGICCLLGLVLGLVLALQPPRSQAIPSTDPAGQVTVLNELYVKTSPMGTAWGTGELEVDSTSTLTGGVHYGAGSKQVYVAAAVLLTSPTTTFSVAGLSRVTLTASTNTTTIVPTDGVAGQEIVIISGAGSNTMRFDDGTDMQIGGNVTLTEGQNDVLALRSLDGTTWIGLSAHDN